MPSFPAARAPSDPLSFVGRSGTATGINTDQMPGGGGVRPWLPEHLSKAPASARAWTGSAVASWFSICLAVLLGGGGGAVAQEAEDLTLLSLDPGQWVMAPKNYASTRFSELDQITTGNVDRLQLVRSFSVGVNRGQEAAPLIVDNRMYVVGPHPNNLFALDATTGDLKWVFSLPTSQAAIGVACCDVVNRSAAYASGKIFYNTLDNHTVAVDARTGKEVWHTKLDDINTGSTMTMAPLVVKGKVLVGNSGGEMGVRGWLTALDENTGEIVWRAYSTGPDEEVLIGAEFEPPYAWMKGEDPGVKTSPPGHWEHGGGTVWGWLSYDPELDLIFYGTGNPGPWNPDQRPGDNLWATTIFARDPDSGTARRAYQTAPDDLWDHDGINELLLLDLEIAGEMREVVVRPGRTGYMYILERATGRVLSAEPYDTVTAYLGVNLETGRIIPNEEPKPEVGETVENVCPAAPGAKDGQPTAWSPRTQLLYVPHQHLCMNFEATEVGYIAGTPYVGAVVDMYAGPRDGYRGQFMAWDLVKQEQVWAIRENFPVWSSTMVTAGDGAFGTMDRWFKAVDARSGEVLWTFRAPSGIIGKPVTYLGADGRQYVAILSGVGGWSGPVAATGPIRACATPRSASSGRRRTCRPIRSAAARFWSSRCPIGRRAPRAMGLPRRRQTVPRPSKRKGGGGHRGILSIAAVALGTLAGAEMTSAKQAADAAQDLLRVCADPNNLPFSNARGEGFENALAELVAGELGKKVSYTWWAQRRGFVRNTLNAGICEVIMGVPQLDMIATTRPYYRSTYVFVSRQDRALDFSSMEAPELRTLRVGVHLIGDDGANTPPAHALGEQHIVDNVVGYMIYGDYREDSPPARLIEAVSRGEIDVAAVWGPLAGFFAQRSPVPLNVVPITDTEAYPPLAFQFPIAMGLRKGDEALADQLNEIIQRRQDAIQALLKRYGVPLVARSEDALMAAER
jgi:lanthanide-dependent methanol dehydrogenase